MIICLGPTPCLQRTMTFDRLAVDAVNRTSRVHEFASGKSTNVARVLDTLGEKAMAITFVGGNTGTAFRSDLHAANIAHDLIDVKPPTRMAVTLVDETNGTATELIEESRSLRAADYDAMLARLSRHLPRARMLVLSGTLPPKASPNFYARCVELAMPRVPVILDVVGKPLLAALKHKPLVVKPNRSELGKTLDMDVSSNRATKRAMRELVSRGARWVVVTNGAEETLIADGSSFWRVTTPPVNVISPIGSGDAFAAGLAAGLARGNDLPMAAKLAAACGAANAMTPHAGHVSSSDVTRIARRTQIAQI